MYAALCQMPAKCFSICSPLLLFCSSLSPQPLTILATSTGTFCLHTCAVKGKRVGVCVSGGLDSKTVCKRLVEEGIDVLAFSADLGQPDESDIQNVKKRMSTCGVDTVIVDLKDDMAEACFDTIQAQARYDGGYWNTTGIGRYVTCRGLVTAMQQNKVDVLAHGATGRGNDQMRFERYTNVLAPKMSVYAPWRDAELLEEFPGRTEMAAYLNKFGIEAFVGPKKKYSTDANLAGLSHEVCVPARAPPHPPSPSTLPIRPLRPPHRPPHPLPHPLHVRPHVCPHVCPHSPGGGP